METNPIIGVLVLLSFVMPIIASTMFIWLMTKVKTNTSVSVICTKCGNKQ